MVLYGTPCDYCHAQYCNRYPKQIFQFNFSLGKRKKKEIELLTCWLLPKNFYYNNWRKKHYLRQSHSKRVAKLGSQNSTSKLSFSKQPLKMCPSPSYPLTSTTNNYQIDFGCPISMLSKRVFLFARLLLKGTKFKLKPHALFVEETKKNFFILNVKLCCQNKKALPLLATYKMLLCTCSVPSSMSMLSWRISWFITNYKQNHQEIIARQEDHSSKIIHFLFLCKQNHHLDYNWHPSQ